MTIAEKSMEDCDKTNNRELSGTVYLEEKKERVKVVT